MIIANIIIQVNDINTNNRKETDVMLPNRVGFKAGKQNPVHHSGTPPSIVLFVTRHENGSASQDSYLLTEAFVFLAEHWPPRHIGDSLKRKYSFSRNWS